LRIGGMHSGIDTDAIVKAMSAATKMRINNNRRKVKKLEAQQTAYRDIISKLQGFQNKYFNVLNRNYFLKSSSVFNQFKSTLYDADGNVKTPVGVSVSSGVNASPGTYEVTLTGKATQATLVSGVYGSNVKLLDFAELEDGEDYGFSIKVGDSLKHITFKAEDDEADTIANINEALKAFGKTNIGEGLVKVGSDWTLSTADKKPISVSNVAKMDYGAILADIYGLETGNNSVNIQIGGEFKTATFHTVEAGYFNILFTGVDAFGEPDGTGVLRNADQIKDYVDAVGLERYETALNKAYDAWREVFDAAEPEDAEKMEEKIFSDAYAIVSKVKDFPYDNKADWLDSGITLEEAYEIVYNNSATNEARIKQYRQSVQSEYDRLSASFNAVVEDKYNQLVNVRYQDWLADFADEAALKAGKDALYDEYYNRKVAEQEENLWAQFYNLKKQAAYGEYLQLQPEPHDAFGDWVWSEYATWEDMRDFALANPTSELHKEFYDEKKGYFGAKKLDYNSYRAGAYSEFEAYKELIYVEDLGLGTLDDLKNAFTSADAMRHYNSNNIKNAIERLTWGNGVKAKVNFETYGEAAVSAVREYVDEFDNPITEPLKFSLTLNQGTTNKFGVDTEYATTAAAIGLNSKVSELAGITLENNGAQIVINGATVKLNGNMTINEMMSAVNNSAAGVTMSFSTLTNTFSLTAKEYGTGASIDIDAAKTSDGLLDVLGFTGQTVVAGTNMVLNINGMDVETPSNSYTVNGTTFTFSSQANEGETFTVKVERDYSPTVNVIKSFVEDYNKLIEEVYGYISEKPSGYQDSSNKYYFLTDDDIEEMELSDRQIEQWEAAAKRGILYNDSSVSTVMEKLRTAMYSGVVGANGKTFGLYSIRGADGASAIKTTSDYKKNGMLEFDEQALLEALETNPDDIVKLFTDAENGLMKKLEDTLNFAVKSTGAQQDMGILVQKAGVSTGLSALNNTIFDQIKRLNDVIGTLETRYEKQQTRYWNIFTAMEKQFAQMNSQSSYISNMFSNMSK
jgi:flagellar capping protein FliD